MACMLHYLAPRRARAGADQAGSRDFSPPDGAERCRACVPLNLLVAGSAFLLLDGLERSWRSRKRGTGTTVYPRELLLTGLVDALAALGDSPATARCSRSGPYGLDDTWLARLGLEARAARTFAAICSINFVTPLVPHPPQEGSVANTTPSTTMRDRPDLAPGGPEPARLLTALCVLYDNDGRLPEDRDQLYKSIVSLVLRSRYPRDARDCASRGRPEAIAHGMHTGEPDGPKRKDPGRRDQLDRDRTPARATSPNVNPAYEQGGGRGRRSTAKTSCTASARPVPKEKDRAGLRSPELSGVGGPRSGSRGPATTPLIWCFEMRASVAEWRLTLLFLFAAQIASKDATMGLRPADAARRAAKASQPPCPTRAPAVFIAEALELCLAKGYRDSGGPGRVGFAKLGAGGAIESEVVLQARQTLCLCLGRLGEPADPLPPRPESLC